MAADNNNFDIATQVVHAGEKEKAPTGQPTTTPIYASATYTYESMEQMDKVFAGEIAGYVYTRHGNPTVAVLQEAIREIEEGATACAYASGMAALHAALFACELSPGSTVLASQDLYGATTNLLLNIFAPLGIKTITADYDDLAGLRAKALAVKPRALIAETISNPLLKLCDIEACANIAHEAGARLIIDNTFASPYLCQPLKHGADLVVHSATKFLGGHADAMGGIAISRDEIDRATLIGVMKLVGGVLSPWEAHEILRGLKTLGVRMDRHCQNARTLAAHLQHDSRISRVYFPELTEGDQQTKSRLLRKDHFGALVTIELKDNTREAAFRFMDALKLCVRSTSLGDVFTSMLHPATASHRDLSPVRRRELGISDGLIRISVGIESIDDIIADIEQALAAGSPGAAATGSV
ncbi:MAG: PLP-dependent aspartate aminotransferase family protein [Pyrinomonadaceae bacterium]